MSNNSHVRCVVPTEMTTTCHLQPNSPPRTQPNYPVRARSPSHRCRWATSELTIQHLRYNRRR